MFAKFKESKLYKLLTKPLGGASKGCAAGTAKGPDVPVDLSAEVAAIGESVRKDIQGK